MKLFAKKTLNGLVVIGESKYYDKLKLGSEVEIDIKKPRNIQFHRKFFALINLVFQNQEELESFEDFRAVFVMRCGFYKIVDVAKRETGEINQIWLPKSISFAKMDELEFNDLYDKALNVAFETIGASADEIKEALSEFL